MDERSKCCTVPGVRVGSWTDPTARTGCTVVLLPDDGAVAAVDVRGAAPGTRETDLLRPENQVQVAHALLLTGGSAFGLAAADGVMRRLEERGVGVATPAGRVPIVPAAVLFDLGVGDPGRRPGPDEGYLATVAAEADAPVQEGPVGAGAGATVGKLFGPADIEAGGLGTAGRRLADGSTVWALAAVNAVGDVVDEQGRVLAGADTVRRVLEGEQPAPPPVGTNTTLVVVGTDLTLTKSQAHRLATVAHDGLAHAIRPVHTSFDGDTVFAFATGGSTTAPGPWSILELEVAAVDVVARAVRRAVRVSR